jgi:transcriptional repressor NrdR
MKCPYCQRSESRVIESRTSDERTVIRRRRECAACQRRFTTYERPSELPLTVVKKNGDREAFDREKIIIGMTRACEKRPVSREAIAEAADVVEREIRDELAEEVPASRVGALVMARLRAMDAVAYVRFASVYKEFRDTDSFLEEINSLVRKAPAPPRGEAPGQAGLFDSQDQSLS